MPCESSWQPVQMGKLVELVLPSPLASAGTVQSSPFESSAETGLLALTDVDYRWEIGVL